MSLSPPRPGLPIRDNLVLAGSAHQDQGQIVIQLVPELYTLLNPEDPYQNAEFTAMFETQMRQGRKLRKTAFFSNVVHTEMIELPEHGERRIDVGNCACGMLNEVSEIDQQLAQQQLSTTGSMDGRRGDGWSEDEVENKKAIQQRFYPEFLMRL
ncbi:hypothetical protein C8J57DRAFT_1235305 [Mycena rebaudengoi]|nr:hypothetical protein C8J57DRAFT_1235305 [Mycena rebaudengoi]